MIAASLAMAAGVQNVVDMTGGIVEWTKAGLPVVQGSSEVQGPDCCASTAEAACQSQAVFWNAKCPTST